MSGAVTVAGIIALLALVIIIAALIQSEREERAFWEEWNRRLMEIEEDLKEINDEAKS
jgi:hypothetical protein